MSKLICPRCKVSTLSWIDPNIDDLNGAIKCDNPECGALFANLDCWRMNLSHSYVDMSGVRK